MTIRFRFATFIVLAAFVSTAAALSAATAMLEQSQPSLSIKLDAVPKPVKGKPYRFSLCTGTLLEPGVVSTRCMPQDAVSVGGAAPNRPIAFQLASGTFLPPGFTLDGNGVINGTVDADLSKLKEIKLCAIQTGQFGTNYNCKGKTVRFQNKVKFTPSTTAKVAKITVVSGAALTGGILAGQAMAELEELAGLRDSVASVPTGAPVTSSPPPTSPPPTSPQPPTSNANYRYGNWNCGTSSQCAAVYGSPTGSVGPLCSQALCADFIQVNPSSGGTTCTVQPLYTVRNGPAPGTACINQR